MPDADPSNPAPDPDQPDTDPDEPAGDGGADSSPPDELRKLRTALATERRARQAAEKAADKLRDEHATDADKALAAARAEGRAEALGEVSARLVEAEVRAAAGGRLADPADAVRLLDTKSFVDPDTGDVDGAAVRSAIDELVEAKPYLAAAAKPDGAGNGHRAPQGTRPGATPVDDGDAFLRSVVRG